MIETLQWKRHSWDTLSLQMVDYLMKTAAKPKKTMKSPADKLVPKGKFAKSSLNPPRKRK